MSKYWLIAKNTLSEYFVYRVNFIFWRLQVVISFLVFYYLWYGVSRGQSQVGSYSLPALFTYFIIGYILRSVVFSTRTADLGSEITSGRLSEHLLKPYTVLGYYLTRDLVDKVFNFGFMVVEFLVFLILLRVPIQIPPLPTILVFLALVTVATLSFFCYSLILSLLALWTEEPWSVRWLFGVVFIQLFNGEYIPLDLMPFNLDRILAFTPYPYLFYFPLQVWLGRLSPALLVSVIVRSLLFLCLLYGLVRWLWHRGLKKYQAYGT